MTLGNSRIHKKSIHQNLFIGFADFHNWHLIYVIVISKHLLLSSVCSKLFIKSLNSIVFYVGYG